MRHSNSVLRDWKRIIPYIHPCYALSNSTSKHTISVMREHRIPMLCETPAQVCAVNDYTLTIEASRFGNNEYITGRRTTADATAATLPLWVYTEISHDGVNETRKVFETIWRHKYILKGIVFDVRNFADTRRSSVKPSLYSYKIAIDYLMRNIVRPFHTEYGIHTPCIMMDGRDNITRPEHLHEIGDIVKKTTETTELHLIVDELFDITRQ